MDSSRPMFSEGRQNGDVQLASEAYEVRPVGVGVHPKARPGQGGLLAQGLLRDSWTAQKPASCKWEALQCPVDTGESTALLLSKLERQEGAGPAGPHSDLPGGMTRIMPQRKQPTPLAMVHMFACMDKHDMKKITYGNFIL